MEWISVKDRLPEDDVRLLMFVENSFKPMWRTEKIGHYDGKFYARDGINTSCETVTHWLYLPQRPEPPKQIKDNQ